MTSLFASFDFSLYLYCFLFLLTAGVVLLTPVVSTSIFKFSNVSLYWGLSEFFLTLKFNKFSKSSSLIFLCIFLLMAFSNFLSVFSYNFPLNSQISVVLFIGLSMWLSFITFSVVHNLSGFLSHTIPEGTPLPLTILLFLIELVSNLIRPLTLTVRLVANILAGHLLMSLLSNLVFSVSLAFIFYLGLNMVELFVALIQSYIFSTMIVLYFSEV